MYNTPPPLNVYVPFSAVFTATVALGIEDPFVREDLAKILVKDGFRVLAFDNGLDMLEYFGDILLLGVAAPHVTVLEVPYEIDTLRAPIFFLLEMSGPSSEHPHKPRAAAA